MRGIEKGGKREREGERKTDKEIEREGERKTEKEIEREERENSKVYVYAWI